MPSSPIIEQLDRYIITDGFHIVVDLQRSLGSWITDLEGNRYLDCYSQFASQPLGWKHSAMIRAQKDMGRSGMCKLANSDMYSKEYENFVDKFAEVTEDFDHYFFIDGGALGVENALKASFDWKSQKMGYHRVEDINNLDVFHLKNAFHGRTGYTLSLTNTTREKTDRYPKFPWTTVNPDADEIREFIHDDVAAIIVEPIQGEGGDNHLSEDFLVSLRDISDENDCMLIFDEVQTGLGITGEMWAYEHFDVVPDMMCFGKKTQVCGFCSTDRIDEIENNVFNTSGRINSTCCWNIVDMVRCSYIIDAIIDQNLIDNAKTVGKYLLNNLINIDYIDNVRGRGLMIAFDLPDTESRDRMMTILSKDMLALKCGEKSIRLRPHLTFDKNDAEAATYFIQKASQSL